MAIGPRHIQVAASWLPSAMTYGTAAGLGLLYFTDWKLIMQYVPYINGKFKE